MILFATPPLLPDAMLLFPYAAERQESPYFSFSPLFFPPSALRSYQR